MGRATKDANTPPSVGSTPNETFSSSASKTFEVLLVYLLPSGCLGISVTLTRPGYGIRKRSKHKASVGKSHIITSQEAKDYLAKEFGVTVA